MIWMIGTTRGAPSLRQRGALADAESPALVMPPGTSERALLDTVMAMAQPGDVVTTGRDRYLIVLKPAAA